MCFCICIKGTKCSAQLCCLLPRRCGLWRRHWQRQGFIMRCSETMDASRMHQQLRLHSHKETLTQREVPLRAMPHCAILKHTLCYSWAELHCSTNVQMLTFSCANHSLSSQIRVVRAKPGKVWQMRGTWYSSIWERAAENVLNGWEACAFVLTKHHWSSYFRPITCI